MKPDQIREKNGKTFPKEEAAPVGTQPTPRNHLNVNLENQSADGVQPHSKKK